MDSQKSSLPWAVCLGTAAATSAIGVWLYSRSTLKRKEDELRRMEEAYWGERRGRCRVEQEMRRISEVQLKTDNGFFIQPIGAIESCYRQCVGTPRQGLLVPSSRAAMVLKSNVSPEALDGLEEFSHVWLIFKFSKNTNTVKEAKAFEGVVSNEDLPWNKRNQKFTFTAKITPPC